jgi:hypothetical protein
MKILALLTMVDGVDPAAFGPHLMAEEQVLWAAYRTAFLREWYFQREPLSVTLIYEATALVDVEKHVASLPMFKAGLLKSHFVILGPWTPLEVLFDPSLKLPAATD